MGRLELVGRERELARLETSWEDACRGVPQVVTVWGHRRVGKTSLVSTFAEARRSVWFGATQQADAVEMARLARAVRADLGTGGTAAEPDYTGWREALLHLGSLAQESPLLVVIDELKALLRASPDFLETLCRVLDGLPAGTRLMLVLIAPPRPDSHPVGLPEYPGRWRSMFLHLDPLTAEQARPFLRHLRPAEYLEAYAACGGYPLHLRQWEEDATTEENLLRMGGTTGGILMDDAEAMLREALPDTGGYVRILAAMGRLQTRYSEILVATDQRIDHPLDVLLRAGLITRALPVGAPPGTNASEYEFADTYLAFWFRVLFPTLAEVEAGRGAVGLRRSRQLWARHIVATFQETARGHAVRLTETGALPPDLLVGRWWSPASREPVDVLGLRNGRSYLVGDVQWSERPLTLADLASARDRVRQVPRPMPQPVLALWGRQGVAPEVREHALGFDVAEVFGEAGASRR